MQVELWKKYIAFEKSNPLRSEDTALVTRRVMFATEQCLLVLTHHPAVWHQAAQYLDQSSKLLTEKGVRMIYCFHLCCPQQLQRFCFTAVLTWASIDRSYRSIGTFLYCGSGMLNTQQFANKLCWTMDSNQFHLCTYFKTEWCESEMMMCCQMRKTVAVIFKGSAYCGGSKDMWILNWLSEGEQFPLWHKHIVISPFARVLL